MTEGRLEKKETPKYSVSHGSIELKGGTGVYVTDVRPAKEETNKKPTLFAGGWSQEMSVYNPAYGAIAERGRRVIGFDHPRYGADAESIGPAIRPKDETFLKDLPESALRKAYTLLGVIDAKKLDSVSVMAHSEGFVAAVAAAIADPRIRNIVTIAPAGFYEEDAYWRLGKLLALAKRAGMQKSEIEAQMPLPEDPAARRIEEQSRVEQEKIAKEKGYVLVSDQTPQELELAKKVGSLAGLEGQLFVAKNPVRAYNELQDLIKVKIAPLVEELIKRRVGITVILPESDSLYPIKKTRNAIRKTGAKVIDVPGDHGQAGERMKIVQIAEGELSILDEQSPSLMKRVNKLGDQA